jgi:hypothetical protein
MYVRHGAIRLFRAVTDFFPLFPQSSWQVGASVGLRAGRSWLLLRQLTASRWLGDSGHETTAAMLAWTFMELAANPDILIQLRNEVDAVVKAQDEVRAPALVSVDGSFSAALLVRLTRLFPGYADRFPPPTSRRCHISDACSRSLCGFTRRPPSSHGGFRRCLSRHVTTATAIAHDHSSSDAVVRTRRSTGTSSPRAWTWPCPPTRCTCRPTTGTDRSSSCPPAGPTRASPRTRASTSTSPFRTGPGIASVKGQLDAPRHHMGRTLLDIALRAVVVVCRFALMGSSVILAQTVRAFDLTLAQSRESVATREGLTIRPASLMVRLQPRPREIPAAGGASQ